MPLRPLGLGEILDGALSYIRAHPRVVLGASAVVAVISQLIQVPMLYFLTRGSAAGVDPSGTPDLAQLSGLFAGFAVGGAVGGLITLVATTVLTGLLMVVISRSVLGAPVDAAECWRAARPRIPGLLGLVVLVFLIGLAVIVVGLLPGGVVLLLGGPTALGVVLMVLGGLGAIVALVWISVSLSLATPAYVLEGIPVTDALRRSWNLVRGRFWPILGIQLLAGIIASVISGIIGIPFSLGGGLLSGESPLPGLLSLTVTAVGTIIALTLTAPFQSGVSGLLYVDQRMRREAFDIELQRASSGGALR